jgi:uncharacterized membrane protein YdjX (TVP38/TMEM64 family)
MDPNLISILVTIGGCFLSVVALFLWIRTESREDYRQMRQSRDEDMRMIGGLLKAINDEMKDFHGRLCAIEERKREKGK